MCCCNKSEYINLKKSIYLSNLSSLLSIFEFGASRSTHNQDKNTKT